MTDLPAPVRRLVLAMGALALLCQSAGLQAQGIHSRIENVAATACYYYVKAKYGGNPEWLGFEGRWLPKKYIGTYRYKVDGQAMPVICKFDEDEGVKVT